MVNDTFKAPPLIITIKIDEASQEYFSSLRKKHFPAHINYLDAHLTFFHKLPPGEKLITDTLIALSSIPSFEMKVTEVKNIGNGVAFGLVSRGLEKLHKDLQQTFDKFLISQDRQILWPHITIQNKVTAHRAKQLTDELQKDFKPFAVTALGFSSWLYLKGPWMPQREYLFIGK